MPRSNLAINWNSRKNPLLRLLSKHLLNQLSITLVHSFHFFLFFNFYCTLFTWNQIINGIATIMIMWKNVSWNQLMLLSFVHKTNVSSSYCYLFSFFFTFLTWNQFIDGIALIMWKIFWEITFEYGGILGERFDFTEFLIKSLYTYWYPVSGYF